MRATQTMSATSRNTTIGALVLLTSATLVLSGAAPAHAVADPVPLGVAEAFAVVAYATVTNTGPSIISGDIGLAPGSAVVGFPPGIQPAGSTYVADALALQARLDADTAFTTASLQPGPVILTGTELGGLTLTPDLYQSPGVLAITGTLTLDAQGNADAIFVFRSLSAFTTAGSSTVELINGASACNVFWIVPSSATLGTDSSLVGTVIATTSITATTGTAVEGRLLALNGAVTLDTTTITSTGCALSTADAEAAAADAAATAAAALSPSGLSGAALASTGVESTIALVAAAAALLGGGALIALPRHRRGAHRAEHGRTMAG